MMVGINIAKAKKNDLVFENSIDVSKYVCPAGAKIDIKNKISMRGRSMLCDLLA